MATHENRHPLATAPDDQVAAYFEALVGLTDAVVDAAGRLHHRPPPDRIGPSATYRDLERLLGYREPTGYRATPSGPEDFEPGHAPGAVDRPVA